MRLSKKMEEATKRNIENFQTDLGKILDEALSPLKLELGNLKSSFKKKTKQIQMWRRRLKSRSSVPQSPVSAEAMYHVLLLVVVSDSSLGSTLARVSVTLSTEYSTLMVVELNSHRQCWGEGMVILLVVILAEVELDRPASPVVQQVNHQGDYSSVAVLEGADLVEVLVPSPAMGLVVGRLVGGGIEEIAGQNSQRLRSIGKVAMGL